MLESMKKHDKGAYISDPAAYIALRSHSTKDVLLEMEVRDCPENCAKMGMVI